MMTYGYTLRRIVEPEIEPVTLLEAKTHCRIDTDVDDTQIEGLIVAARMWAETVTRRALVEQVWRLTLDSFPPSDTYVGDRTFECWARGTIELPRPRLILVDSVTYVSDAGDSTLLDPAEYRVVNDTDQPARILPVYGESWPTTRDDVASVIVQYTAGYAADASPADASNVPQPIKEAIKMHVEAHYDRDMETMDRLVRAAKNLLADYRVYGF